MVLNPEFTESELTQLSYLAAHLRLCRTGEHFRKVLKLVEDFNGPFSPAVQSALYALDQAIIWIEMDDGLGREELQLIAINLDLPYKSNSSRTMANILWAALEDAP